MNKRTGARPDAIERQLAHKDRNKVHRAYNHAKYLDERRTLMQWRSDYLDARLADGVKAIPQSGNPVPPNIPPN